MTARKSAALKALEGTARPDRALKVAGGVRLVTAPKPPAGLGKDAARQWRQLARLFTAAGTLTAADLPMLRLLCEALGDEVEARATLATEGWTIKGAAGAIKHHPAVRRGEAARALATRLLIEFGASPVARQKIAMAPLPIDRRAADPWGEIRALQEGKLRPQRIA